MPERKYKAYQTLNSEPVQGEGSWVKVRNPRWDDVSDMVTGENGKGSEAELGLRVIEGLVEDWNWVDDEGEPLPAPSPEIVRSLPLQELMFLVSSMGLDNLDPKAFASGSGST